MHIHIHAYTYKLTVVLYIFHAGIPVNAVCADLLKMRNYKITVIYHFKNWVRKSKQLVGHAYLFRSSACFPPPFKYTSLQDLQRSDRVSK